MVKRYHAALAVNLLLLTYNAQRAVVHAVFNMIFGSGGSIVSIDPTRGIPLVLQYPMYADEATQQND